MSSIPSGLLKYKCTRFTGNTQHVLVGNFSTYNFEKTNPFSLSCWLKWTSTTLMSHISKLPLSSPGETGWDLYLASGKWGFTLKTTLSNQVNVATSDSFNDGRWHHLAVTYSGNSLASGVTMYVDGAAVTKVVNSDNLGSTILNTAPFIIGSRPESGWGTVGDALDVAVYNKQLTSGEVVTIFNKRCPPDLTSVGPTGNLVGYWLLGQHVGKTGLSSKKTTYPTVPDAGSGNHSGTMTNMSSGSVITRI